MISIGPEKLLFVFFVAALVLGPDKMPGAARKVGRVISELRRLADGVDPRSVLDHISEEHDDSPRGNLRDYGVMMARPREKDSTDPSNAPQTQGVTSPTVDH